MKLQDITTQNVDVGAAINEGLQLCRADEWQSGLEILWKIARKQDRDKALPSLYYSYAGYGAAKFDGNLKEGIKLCRHAIKVDPLEPDNYLNLARVEILRHNRKTAVRALQRGLRVRPDHPRLLEFKRDIGFRRPPVIRFLSRDNRLNIWLGKHRYLRDLESEAQS